jgi:hypothetical protein
MQPFRSAKSAYIAAFLLGALIALICVAPAHSSEPSGNALETYNVTITPAS